MTAGKIFLHSLLIVVTIAYCWFIELAMAAFNTLLANWELTELSMLSVITAVKPLPWQILAIASLLINSVIAFIVSKKENGFQAHITAAVCHMLWIVSCVLIHGVGFLISFVIRTYAIQ